jgi:HD-like signal output (HDOD) protein/prolyl-tRNA editing enzyme YbaK/EbsC (Cys-tRNA(Pro) deacylase)
MALPNAVKDYLDRHKLPYRLISYPARGTFQQISEAIQIPSSHLIRAVLLRDEQGYLMAVLPSNYILDFSLLRQLLGRDLLPLYGDESTDFFKDCQPGSRPPLAELFGLTAIVEESLAQLEGELYFDAGSHDTLVCMTSPDCRALLGEIRWGHFAIPLDALDLLQKQAATPEDLMEVTSSYVPKQLKEMFKELPALPAAARHILELRAHAGRGMEEVARFIEQYPELAAAIIRYTGSPLYAGQPNEVHSVQEAMAVLGLDIIAGLGFALSLSRTFRIPSDGPLGSRAFWRHAVYCAALTRELARALPAHLYLQPGLVYWSGLLHKFGYLVLAQLFPAQFFLLNRFLAVNNQIPVEQVEGRLLGVDNGQIGAWLTQAWNMPKEFTAAIRWHSQEDYSQPYAEYPNLILIANRLLYRLGIGDETTGRLPLAIMASLGLPREPVLAALTKVQNSQVTLEELSRALAA